MRWKLSICPHCMNVKACPANIYGTHSVCPACGKEHEIIELDARLSGDSWNPFIRDTSTSTKKPIDIETLGLTEEDVEEFGKAFLDNVDKELGIENDSLHRKVREEEK